MFLLTVQIASSLGDPNRSSERFSVSKLICICVAVLQQLYSTVSKPKTTATNSPTSKEIPRRVSTAEEAPSVSHKPHIPWTLISSPLCISNNLTRFPLQDISDSSDDTEGSDDFQEDALRARVSIGASEHPASSSDHQIKSLADVAKRVFQMVPEGGQAPGSSLGERLHQPVEWVACENLSSSIRTPLLILSLFFFFSRHHQARYKGPRHDIQAPLRCDETDPDKTTIICPPIINSVTTPGGPTTDAKRIQTSDDCSRPARKPQGQGQLSLQCSSSGCESNPIRVYTNPPRFVRWEYQPRVVERAGRAQQQGGTQLARHSRGK
jgi:hypothetical protein